MMVILAQINSEIKISGEELIYFYNGFNKLGIGILKFATTAKRLEEILETNTEEECFLFTNFPPNSSYPGSEKPVQYKDMGEYIGRSWVADSYTKSTKLFINICNQYNLKAIHFITGAPDTMVDEKYLQKVCKNTSITYKSIKEWVIPGNNYEVLYQVYITGVIKQYINLRRMVD